MAKKTRRKTKRSPYNIPDEEDFKLREVDYEKFYKALDDEGRILPNKAATMLRSAIRQVWMRSPSKLAYLLKHAEPDMDPNTRTLWVYECEMCGGKFKKADIELDHIHGEHKLTDPSDFNEYFDKILNAPWSEMQKLCIPCHAIKTHAERYGLTIEEATKEKEVLRKLDQTVAEQKKELIKAGYKTTEVSNDKKRRQCYKDLLS